MSVILSMWNEESSNSAADRGNLVHAAAHAFHTSEGDREAAGLAALQAARDRFRLGNAEEASAIFKAYAQDKENQNARVLYSETKVRLTLPACEYDPTGEPIVFAGTLDQVREKQGRRTVWDIKTGGRLSASDTAAEYAIQQAVYTLAARETLDAFIEPGGIIYTPNYGTRGRVHVPLKQNLEQCRALLQPIVYWVALVRQGEAVFKPSADNCNYCPHKPWPACHDQFRGTYGL